MASLAFAISPCAHAPGSPKIQRAAGSDFDPGHGTFTTAAPNSGVAGNVGWFSPQPLSSGRRKDQRPGGRNREQLPPRRNVAAWWSRTAADTVIRFGERRAVRPTCFQLHVGL